MFLSPIGAQKLLVSVTVSSRYFHALGADVRTSKIARSIKHSTVCESEFPRTFQMFDAN